MLTVAGGHRRRAWPWARSRVSPPARMVGFIFLVYRFLEPIAEFTEILDQTQTAVAGWRRVLAVLETPIEIVEPRRGRRAARRSRRRIEVDHVTFVYRPRPGQAAADGRAGARRRDVHDRARPRTSPSSAPPARASRRWPSCSPAWPTRPRARCASPAWTCATSAMASLRSTLVMVPQEPFLFDTTILENVRFGRRDASDDEVRLAFIELGLDGWVDGLADGIGTRVGERGEHLSAGERQLVALARAYVANPSCLILDEATSAVDPATEARLARALESLARGPHLGHHRPPAVDGCPGRLGARVRTGPAGRAGPPRRPAGGQRRLRRAPRLLDRRHLRHRPHRLTR